MDKAPPINNQYRTKIAPINRLRDEEDRAVLHVGAKTPSPKISKRSPSVYRVDSNVIETCIDSPNDAVKVQDKGLVLDGATNSTAGSSNNSSQKTIGLAEPSLLMIKRWI